MPVSPLQVRDALADSVAAMRQEADKARDETRADVQQVRYGAVRCGQQVGSVGSGHPVGPGGLCFPSCGPKVP